MSVSKQAIAIGLVVTLVVLNLLIFLSKMDNRETIVTEHSSMFGTTKLFSPENETIHSIRTLEEIADNISTTESTVMAPLLLRTQKPDEDFMTRQENIQRQRRATLHDTCAKYGLNTKRDLSKMSLSRLIVDEKNKLVYCSVPKVACTSWKRVFLVLNGVMNHTYDLSQSQINNKVAPRKLKYLQFYRKEQVEQILRDYTKFLVVRQPFSRVLSAFRNKLAPESTFEKASSWQMGLGMSIIRHYRKFSRPKTPHTSIKLNVDNRMVNYDLTFAEFVRYLIDPKAHDFKDNQHWKEISKLCSPCLIDYDIISTFESIEADAEYILRLVHADSVVKFPSANGSSPTNSSQTSIQDSFYKDVPKSDLNKLYQQYKLDFELFGYKKPDILQP